LEPKIWKKKIEYNLDHIDIRLLFIIQRLAVS